MGDFADDLSMDYDGEMYSQMSKREREELHRSRIMIPSDNKPVYKTGDKKFTISIVDSNMNVVWSNVVDAKSSIGARDKFRTNFKDVRARYRSAGGYMLKVKKV